MPLIHWIIQPPEKEERLQKKQKGKYESYNFSERSQFVFLFPYYYKLRLASFIIYFLLPQSPTEHKQVCPIWQIVTTQILNLLPDIQPNIKMLKAEYSCFCVRLKNPKSIWNSRFQSLLNIFNVQFQCWTPVLRTGKAGLPLHLGVWGNFPCCCFPALAIPWESPAQGYKDREGKSMEEQGNKPSHE